MYICFEDTFGRKLTFMIYLKLVKLFKSPLIFNTNKLCYGFCFLNIRIFCTCCVYQSQVLICNLHVIWRECCPRTCDDIMESQKWIAEGLPQWRHHQWRRIPKHWSGQIVDEEGLGVTQDSVFYVWFQHIRFPAAKMGSKRLQMPWTFGSVVVFICSRMRRWRRRSNVRFRTACAQNGSFPIIVTSSVPFFTIIIW